MILENTNQSAISKKKILTSYKNLSQRVILLVILFSSLIDLPGFFQLWYVSGLLILTAISLLLIWFTLFLNPFYDKKIIRVLLPLIIFLIWMIISNIWGDLTDKAIQNQVVFLGFFGAILLSSRSGFQDNKGIGFLGRIIDISTIIAVSIFLINYVGKYFNLDIPFGIGNRSFALYLLIPISWYQSGFRHGQWRNLIITLILIGLILLSLSRMALLASIVIVILSFSISKSIKMWVKLFITGALGLLVMFLLFTYYQPLATRDAQTSSIPELSFQVGNVSIYASGRVRMWRATFDSIKESPWIGHGPGSAAAVVLEETGWLEHPHNDYLRILNDYGIVGTVIFVSSIGLIFISIWKLWKKNEQFNLFQKRIHLTTIFSLTGMLMAMITDNIIVYSFMMYPLGILIGISLGFISEDLKKEILFVV